MAPIDTHCAEHVVSKEELGALALTYEVSGRLVGRCVESTDLDT